MTIRTKSKREKRKEKQVRLKRGKGHDLEVAGQFPVFLIRLKLVISWGKNIKINKYARRYGHGDGS